jgi:putative tricarboxylic transport membrane protein
MKLAMRMLAFAVFVFSCEGVPAASERCECIVPAKPGGGFDLTCRLALSGFQASGVLKNSCRVSYMPGGIGAVAYNAVVAQRPAEGRTIVAFSSGSLLNLAQGKFGKYNENDVRWVAAIGADHGVITVRADSAFSTLGDLMQALKREPARVIFGAGGTIGSQDWIKSALIARAAGLHHKSLRFVAFEGGGEAFTALLAGHVQVVPGDASEVLSELRDSKVRVLAVLSEERLPGALKDIPTAKEQGYDLSWSTIRGVYMGPKVTDSDYRFWTNAFAQILPTGEFAALRADRGLYFFALTGAALESYVKKAVREYTTLAKEFGLVK